MKVTRVDTNIDQLPNGRFRVDLYLTNRNTGKRERIRKTFATLTTAQEFRRTKTAENELSLWRLDSGEHVTVDQAIELAKLEKIKSYRKKNRSRRLPKEAVPPSFDDMVRHLDEIKMYFGPSTALLAIQEDWIDEFADCLLQRPKRHYHKGTLSNQSVDHCLKELRYVLRLAHRQQLIAKMPTINFIGNYGERIFELDMDSFIAVVNKLPAPPQPHRAMMLMALNTGQRAGDLSAMRWEQVRDDHITYRSSKTQREGIKAPLMPITWDALVALRQKACSCFPEIFINPYTRKPITTIKKSLLSACEKAGVERFTIHHMRHLATTVLLEYTNGDRDLVKRIIGWSNMEMIERYGHIGNRAVPAFTIMNQKLAGRIKTGLGVTRVSQ